MPTATRCGNQLPDVDDESIVTEPSARDSMAAIGFAAALLELEHPDVVMGSFAADHVIADPERFGEAVRTAVAAARDDWLVTIGIDPTFPSSAFGYIHLGDELSDHPGVSAVREFVEKPSAEVATEYVASGRYRWNAGMFVVRPRVLLELLAESDPDFTATLREIVAEPSRLEELWPTLPKIALDHAVAEPAAAAGRVVTVPASFGWDDIGDFDSLATILEAADPEGDDGMGSACSGNPTWSARSTAPASSSRQAARPSPWSGSTTSSWSTPPTPSWSPPARGPSRSRKSSPL